MRKDRYEAVTAPTRTAEELAAAKEFRLKYYRECVVALGVATSKLIELNIPIPEMLPERQDVL